MNRIKQKVERLLLGSVLVMSLFAGATTIKAATGPAPSDWAFEESSRPLNDAIVEAYPLLDNGSGFVTISSANAMTGILNVQGKNISGTLSGIENFVQINRLDLRNNNLIGEIPQNIDELVNLNFFNLANNQLSGSIPIEIANLTNLQLLVLYGNQIEGNIPSEFGNLVNLTSLDLSANNLTGSIPSSLGDLSELNNLELHSNSLSGEVPQNVFALQKLIKVQLQGNNNLTGNPAIGFASSTTLNYLDIRGTSLIQASPEIATLSYTIGTFLYDNLADELLIDSKTNLADSVIQETIDKVQESADFITDSVIKQQWQDDIDLAQKMLNAKEKVDELLTTPDLANLKNGVTQATIDDAQNLVVALPNGVLKDDLQAKIDTAKNLLDAKEKVEKLFNSDGTLASGVDKVKIDEAQEAINKLPGGQTKIALQKAVDEAYELLNAKTAPSTVPGQKPTASGTSTETASSLSTGDMTNDSVYFLMLMSSLALVGLFIYRKRQTN